MRILKLNSLCGIKNQLYSMDQYVDPRIEHRITNGFFDINSLFWSETLSPTQVKKTLNIALCRLKNDSSPKVRAVLNNPDSFYATYLTSLEALSTPTTEHTLFQSLETLEIICYIHSRVYSYPFTLTLANGYIHSKYSAQDLWDTCLLNYRNPYLSFIESWITPQITNYNPDILILTGQPNVASFAIARKMREINPSIFIIASEYDSDYYSLKKIKNLLVVNSAFFSAYHCVVYNNSNKTIKRIEDALLAKKISELSKIEGIVFSLDNGKTIVQTTNSTFQDIEDNKVDSFCKSHVLNIRAFSNHYCYWNKCTFCGINSKYVQKQDKDWDVKALIEKIRTLNDIGIKKIWFEDESIPADILNRMAEQFLSNEINTIWHVRTRIELEYIEKPFSRLLWKAGLRHILFGFESASNRILKLMNKTNNTSNYLETAEKIVKNLTEHGIFVHFSTIIGFPTETQEETIETTDFLKYLKTTYPFFSYNINIFYLDIGSAIYRSWEHFGVCNLAYPCRPKYFLENHINWSAAISPTDYSVLKNEQEQTMFQQFPWYPKGAIIKPSIFFSFWEHSRYGLQNYTNIVSSCRIDFSMSQIMSLNTMVSFLQLDDGQWLLYHLKNHHYVIGGSILKDIVNACHAHLCFSVFLHKYQQPYKKQIRSLINQLTRMEFFTTEND